MKLHLLLSAAIVFVTTLMPASAEEDARVVQIRKWYALAEAAKNLKKTVYKTGAEEEPQSTHLTRYESPDGKLQKIYVEFGGEHGIAHRTFYFNEGKLYFLNESALFWHFTGEERKDQLPEVVGIAYDNRYYFEKGKCFKALKKYIVAKDDEDPLELLKKQSNKEQKVDADMQKFYVQAMELAAIKSKEDFEAFLKK